MLFNVLLNVNSYIQIRIPVWKSFCLKKKGQISWVLKFHWLIQWIIQWIIGLFYIVKNTSPIPHILKNIFPIDGESR